MKAIVNGKLILRDKIIGDKVIIFDERIVGIQDDMGSFEDLEVIDAKGCYVSPGFIDIHIHGAYGSDVMDGETDTLEAISQGLCKSGVTGFLPTTISMSKERTYKALDHIRDRISVSGHGARVIGAHLEGPFINPIKKGAHDEQYIIKPDFQMIKEYIDIVKIITVAPEMDEKLSFIRGMCCHKHVSLSIGHSNATYEQAMEAIEAGIKSATHLFNAMSGLEHRNPGIVGAVLNSDIYCELIADKVHVHPAIYQILAKTKGVDKLILITDAMRASCMKSGTYELGGQSVHVEAGAVRLSDGTLAGSVLRLNEAVRNFRDNTDIPLHEVIGMVTMNPATLIGIEKETGSLEIGKRADITILNENLDVIATFVAGQKCYSQL